MGTSVQNQDKAKKQRRIVVLGLLVVLVICVCCLIVFVVPGMSPSVQATRTAEAIAEATEDARPTETPAPTNTEGPTPTPGPTDTPAPTNTPEPTATLTLAPVGESRTNPVPAGMAVEIEGGMILTIVGAVRPADEIVEDANSFNTDPEAGQEYLQVEFEIVCNKEASDTCSLFTSSIKAVGSDGIIHTPEIFVSGVDGQIETGEFFGGATKAGILFFLVPAGDEGVVLFFEPLLFGETVYFGLPVGGE